MSQSVGNISLTIVLLLACERDDIRQTPLPARTVPPDTSLLTEKLRTEGGPILLELTGWASPAVIAEFEGAGLRPLPGYEQVERLDSMGLNVVGGIVSPRDMPRLLQFPYIVRVRPADVEYEP